MKPLKFGLRIWIGITSIISFLGGWALFSHAGKPAPLISSPTVVSAEESAQGGSTAGVQFAPIPTLPPMPSMDEPSTGSNLQPLPSLPFTTQQSAMPRFRTRGS